MKHLILLFTALFTLGVNAQDVIYVHGQPDSVDTFVSTLNGVLAHYELQEFAIYRDTVITSGAVNIIYPHVHNDTVWYPVYSEDMFIQRVIDIGQEFVAFERDKDWDPNDPDDERNALSPGKSKIGNNSRYDYVDDEDFLPSYSSRSNIDYDNDQAFLPPQGSPEPMGNNRYGTRPVNSTNTNAPKLGANDVDTGRNRGVSLVPIPVVVHGPSWTEFFIWSIHRRNPRNANYNRYRQFPTYQFRCNNPYGLVRH